MKNIKAYFVAFFMLAHLLLACSGASAQKKTDLHIIYIGDSITQGAMLDDVANNAPPAIASKFLRQQPRIGKVDFSNQGRSGFTTVDFAITGNAFERVEQAANNFKNEPGILIFSIMLGTNDSAVKGTNGAPVSPEAYYANLLSITRQLLKDFPGCRIIIHRAPWYSPNTYNNSEYMQEGLDRLISYYPFIKKLVKDYNKTAVNHVFFGDTQAFDYFEKNYLTDFRAEDGRKGTFYLHPNLKGANVLGELWGKAIYRVLKKG